MKKIKILFDATIISGGYAKNSNRSGIFFASMNILKELLKRPDCEVSLYSAPAAISALQVVVSDQLKEYPHVEIINKNDTSLLGGIQNNLTIRKLTARGLHLKILRGLSLATKVLIVLQSNFYRSEILELHLPEFDVFYSPGYLAPAQVRKNDSIKCYTLLYDTIPLLYPAFSPFMRFGYSWVKRVIDNLSSDDYCFSISEQTKKDFLKFCPDLIPERVVVTHLAASDNFYQCKNPSNLNEIKRKYKIPLDKKYIFSLCTLEPRKNLIMAVMCFIKLIQDNAIDDLIFVLGGGHWEKFIGTLEKELGDLSKYKSKIIRAGYIEDEDLAPLFSNAEFFVYPSLYEGFGLPPLEAMQCGTPVITSNTSSLTEVVGDAGIMVDPQSEAELVEAMKKLYFNEELRRDYLEKGLERAKQFSWEKCVDTMVKEMANNQNAVQ